MKPTELMVGDWVWNFDPIAPEDKRPYKVSQINGEWDEGDIKLEPFSDWFDSEWFAPIRLTAEILEKNGWTFMAGQEYSTFPVQSKWIYPFVPFALIVNGGAYSIANTFTIKYVHELQHALRLCGLTELADHFKL